MSPPTLRLRCRFLCPDSNLSPVSEHSLRTPRQTGPETWGVFYTGTPTQTSLVVPVTTRTYRGRGHSPVVSPTPKRRLVLSRGHRRPPATPSKTRTVLPSGYRPPCLHCQPFVCPRQWLTPFFRQTTRRPRRLTTPGPDGSVEGLLRNPHPPSLTSRTRTRPVMVLTRPVSRGRVPTHRTTESVTGSAKRRRGVGAARTINGWRPCMPTTCGRLSSTSGGSTSRRTSYAGVT